MVTTFHKTIFERLMNFYFYKHSSCHLLCLVYMMKSSNGNIYWPFVRGIHQSLVNSPHKGQWRGALMFSFICVWINIWVKNHEVVDLRCYRVHHDVTVMYHIINDSHRYRIVTFSCVWYITNFPFVTWLAGPAEVSHKSNWIPGRSLKMPLSILFDISVQNFKK